MAITHEEYLEIEEISKRVSCLIGSIIHTREQAITLSALLMTELDQRLPPPSLPTPYRSSRGSLESFCEATGQTATYLDALFNTNSEC